jgi:hypothetical protein
MQIDLDDLWLPHDPNQSLEVGRSTPAYREQEIALLDEHDLTDPQGKVVFSLTAQRLKEIAANNNRRIQETGDEIPIVIGHTKDGLDEQKQPLIVGWARDLTVKPLFETGRKAIFAKARFEEGKLDLIKKFPRRSVELWLRKMMIDPISLLGATTPERDLGLLKFANGDHKYASFSPSEEPMNVDEIVQKVLAALEQTDVFQWARQQMEQSQEEPAEAPPGGQGSPGEEPVAPMGQGQEMPQEEPQEQPAQYAASAPSGSNTFLPGSKGNMEPDRVKMAMNQLEGKLVRYQQAYEQQATELQDVRVKLQKATREKDLLELDGQGVQFDMAEELADVAEMPEVQYQKHLERMKVRYQKAPVGNPYFKSAERVKALGQSPSRGQADVNSVVDYATAHNLSYQEALAQMQGSATKVI